MTADLSALTVGVLGGTGPQGRGLAFRWATAGIRVVLGSRVADRAAAAASELGAPGVTGADNASCASAADIVVAVVPWEGHGTTLLSLADPLAGKILVDCVVPMGFDKQGPYPLRVAEGSAAEQARALLPDTTVTAAFHHVSAALLGDPSVEELDCDVLVLGDDRSATDLVRALADAIPGMRGIYGGRLRNAMQVETLTCNLIAINRRYHAHAGIRITDV